MTILVYSVKEYNEKRWLQSETWWLSPIEAARAAARMKFYALTMYELNEPLNPVALLSRVSFCKRFEIIEDTTWKVGEPDARHTILTSNRVSSPPLTMETTNG